MSKVDANRLKRAFEKIKSDAEFNFDSGSGDVLLDELGKWTNAMHKYQSASETSEGVVEASKYLALMVGCFEAGREYERREETCSFDCDYCRE